MKYLVFDNYKLIVDNEKNYRYYYNLFNEEDDCCCPGCRNFKESIARHCPSTASAFFENLGINIQRANQIIPYYGINKKIMSYGGYYHCCGNISGEEYLTETILISDRFRVSFQKECDLKNMLMPNPTFQINFKIDLPWVLNEENIYCGVPKTSKRRRQSI